MSDPTFAELLRRLISPATRSASARTVEAFGWLIFLEGNVLVLAPYWVAWLLSLSDFSAATAVYFRLAGLLVAGLGLLYIVSGRLNSREFVFASMLDRPLVPFVMLGFWYWAQFPAVLAILFSLQDFGGFLWTLWAWRNEKAPSSPPRR